jgi:hypothetical protein
MEHVDYVPTQIVTEYFRHRFRLSGGGSLDGIKYRSSRTGQPACVLFFDSDDCGGETEFLTKKPVLQLQDSATERIPGKLLIGVDDCLPR